MLPRKECSMSDFRLVDKKGLKAIYGIPYCPQYIAVLEKQGRFPKRVNLGACRVAWYCSEVEAWIASRPRDDD
jgi:prophage regulatory protein